jgi:hypothetical protein
MRFLPAVVSTLLLTLVACANVPMGAGRTASSVDMSGTDLLGQTQLPPGARILHEQSLVIGTGDNWVGRVVMDSARDTTSAYSYFLDNYPSLGWTLLSAVRAKSSVLVFNKGERNVTIEIQEGNPLSGGSALVILTLAPRSANVVSPALAKKPAPVEGTVPSKP